jgi:hypothetical protein
MPKYLITVREEIYHTYMVESEAEIDEVEHEFYKMNENALKANLVTTEGYSWEIDNVEEKND